MKRRRPLLTILAVVIFCVGTIISAVFFGPNGIKAVRAVTTGWQINGDNLYCSETTKIGIGTNAPNGLLEIKSATPVVNINGTASTNLHGISLQTNGEETAIIKTKSNDGELRLQTGMKSAWGGYQTFYTNNVERMRVTSNGNVGIGLNNPASALQVKGEFSIFDRTDGQNYRYVFLPETTADGPGGRLRIGYKGADGSFLSDIMSFMWKGWVGVGTNDPQAKLDVNGSDSNNVFTVRSNSGQVKIMPWKADVNGDANYLESGNGGWTANRPLFFTGYNGADGVFNFKGNVGIGTNAPNGLLEIKSATPVVNINGTASTNLHGISLQTNGEETAIIKTKSNDGELRLQTGMKSAWGGYQTFYTNNVERMRVDSAGNVGIGNTAPDKKLTVAGEIKADGAVYSGGGFKCSSDERLKTNIKPIENSLAKILDLNGVSFQWKNDAAGPNQLGVIAQEVEKVVPELVSTDASGYKSVNYDGFSALLINAVREQQASINQLKNDNQELKLRLERLEAKINN